MKWPNLDLGLGLVRVISLLVPAGFRREWLDEWCAELQCAGMAMRSREYTPGQIEWRLLEFALGSLQDALWHRLQVFEPEAALRELRAGVEAPRFCLAVHAGVLVLIALATGFLPATRDVLFPLPYRDASRIATVAQSGLAVATRSGARSDRIAMWRRESRLLEDVAAYTWRPESAGLPSAEGVSVLTARVSENFFALLGARTVKHSVISSCA